MATESETAFFEALCRDHYKRIFQYLVVKVHDYGAAEDLTQNVFAVAWEKRQTLLAHENPLGFLYVTAQNLAFAYLRKAKKAPLPLSDSFDPADVDGDVAETLAKEADAKIDEGAYVNDVLNALPLATMTLYREYYVEKHSIKEIAQAYGVSEVSVRMRLVRLRKRVKKEVEKQNFNLL